MYNGLRSFLEKNIILFHAQFGFRSNHSTNHAILLITDKIQKAIEIILLCNFSCLDQGFRHCKLQYFTEEV